ncbi:MAG TPA: hypothetical protein DEO85_00850 [Maritimibacter sp.]|nr:hypothetical protein [Maritimibacter sp.]
MIRASFFAAFLAVFATPSLGFDENFGSKKGCLAWLDGMNIRQQSFEGIQSRLYRQKGGVPETAIESYEALVEQNRIATAAVAEMVDQLLKICVEYE